jgi:hypothetical protein
MKKRESLRKVHDAIVARLAECQPGKFAAEFVCDDGGGAKLRVRLYCNPRLHMTQEPDGSGLQDRRDGPGGVPPGRHGDPVILPRTRPASSPCAWG